MPEPKNDEKRDDFVSRCIPVVLNEGVIDDVSHAAAKCHGIFDQWLKKKGKK